MSDGGDNGNGEGGGTKDTASLATTLGEGDDGVHGPWFVCFCVCGEITKNKVVDT